MKPGDIVNDCGDIFVSSTKLLAKGKIFLTEKQFNEAKKFGWVLWSVDERSKLIIAWR